MLPKDLLLRVNEVRDMTLTLVADVYRFPPEKHMAAGLVPEESYWIGKCICRLDAIESAGPREYGLTMEAEAEPLFIGDWVYIEGVPYRVERVQDCYSESILRRYVVSITEGEFRDQ